MEHGSIQASVKEMLDLIRETKVLLQEEPMILASAEEADYFRFHKPRHFAGAPHSADSIAYPGNSKSCLDIRKKPPSLLQSEEVAPKAAPSKPKEEKKEPLAALPKEKDRPVPESAPPSSNSDAHKDFSFIRSLLKSAAPECKILETIPCDKKAQQTAQRWKIKNQSAALSLLSYGELAEHKKLLEEIASALQASFGDARLIEAEPIEKENLWEMFLSGETIRLIIICDAALWQLQGLRRFYRENPAENSRKIGNYPLLLLPDLSLYFKDPWLKRSLWKALCQKLTVS